MTPASTRARPSDKDLRELAKRAKQSTRARPFALSLAPLAVLRAGLLLLVAAVASYVSQISLAPVYGEIPSGLNHDSITTALFIGVWALKSAPGANGAWAPFSSSALVPIIAFSAPLLLLQVFQFSTELGPVYGPIFTEGITYYPLLALSVSAAASLMHFNNIILDLVPAGLSFAAFSAFRNSVPGLLQSHIGKSWLLTRCGLWNVLGGISALASPSLLLLAAVPSVFYSALWNPMCVDTPAMNATLAKYNHSLINRQESITGYISIIDNFDAGYRAMRCDHSLLGGEWQRPPKDLALPEGHKFKEPIYAIFVIMEAVRLLDPPPKNPSPSALAIGLGIGTSTDAMIKHGVKVDIVELDPVVYKYAKDYFGLSANHTAYLEDAVGFVDREATRPPDQRHRYDYILHDVFTGGAVPTSLFTLELFQGLRELLAEDGVIAINWAGDLKLKAARSIIATIQLVFNNCRAFREEQPSEEDSKDMDFTNMVVFCTRSSEPYTFRRPTEADYLDSFARRQFLYPEFEIDLQAYWSNFTDRIEVLQKKTIEKTLGEWQKKSAVGHWKVIRGVVPGRVWELY